MLVICHSAVNVSRGAPSAWLAVVVCPAGVSRTIRESCLFTFHTSLSLYRVHLIARAIQFGLHGTAHPRPPFPPCARPRLRPKTRGRPHRLVTGDRTPANLICVRDAVGRPGPCSFLLVLALSACVSLLALTCLRIMPGLLCQSSRSRHRAAKARPGFRTLLACLHGRSLDSYGLSDLYLNSNLSLVSLRTTTNHPHLCLCAYM